MTIHAISAIGRSALLTEIVVKLTDVPAPEFITFDDRFPAMEIAAWPSGADPSEPPIYTGRVVLVDAQRVVSQTMHASDPYRGLGIPEACLLLVRTMLARPLYSSTNAETLAWLKTEYQAPEAEKVWRRLERCGWAKFDAATYRFLLP